MSAICGAVGEGSNSGKGTRNVLLELLEARGPDGALRVPEVGARV